MGVPKEGVYSLPPTIIIFVILVMGFCTIEEGQQALIFNDRGRGRLVIGPVRVSTQLIVSVRTCIS